MASGADGGRWTGSASRQNSLDPTSLGIRPAPVQYLSACDIFKLCSGSTLIVETWPKFCVKRCAFNGSTNFGDLTPEVYDRSDNWCALVWPERSNYCSWDTNRR